MVDGGADQAGPHRRMPAQPGARRSRRTSASGDQGGDQGQEDEDDRTGEAVGGELEAALGDIGEIVEATGVQHRAGQVGVGAGDEVDQRRGMPGPRTAAAMTSSAARRRRAAITAAATAAPTGKTIAAPTSAPKLPAAKIEAKRRPTRQEGDRAAARREAAGRTRPGPPRCRRRSGPPAAPRARCRSRRTARRGRDSAPAARAVVSGEPATTSTA